MKPIPEPYKMITDEVYDAHIAMKDLGSKNGQEKKGYEEYLYTHRQRQIETSDFEA